MKFTSNMGKMDRTLRLIVALVIGILYYLGKITGPMGSTLLLLAIVFAITAVIRFCPLYVPFNMDTREEKSDS